MNNPSISFPIFGENFVFNPPSHFYIFGFPIFYYGVIIVFGFVLAGLYLYKRREHLELSPDNIFDMIILAILGGLVGARAYYVIFRFDHFFGSGSDWLDIFRVRQGGLAVYGGIFGAMVLVLIYSHVKKFNYLKLFDAGVFGLFIGQAVGRWGNLFNREAFGTETQMPWRMGLTDFTGTIYVHPAFLYESLWNILGLIILHSYSKKRGRKYYGQYFLFYAAWYGFGRFFIEGLRVDSLFMPGTAIRISQIIAALSFIIAAVLIVLNFVRKTNNVLKELPVEAAEFLAEYSEQSNSEEEAPCSCCSDEESKEKPQDKEVDETK